MAKVFKITDHETQNNWTVRIVFEGQPYGLDMCLTHDEADPLIEFYDAEYDFDQDETGATLGQFVGRYCARTLLADINDPRGINLEGSVPKWQIKPDCYGDILRECARAIRGNEAAA